jgi:hypothetical protein
MPNNAILIALALVCLFSCNGNQKPVGSIPRVIPVPKVAAAAEFDVSDASIEAVLEDGHWLIFLGGELLGRSPVGAAAASPNTRWCRA